MPFGHKKQLDTQRMKQMNQTELMTSHQLKKMIPQLLLSLSLFSFVFSYSSSLVSSPKFHYGNTFHLLSNTLNKNYLFLICNGLLVFLAKTSGLIRPPAGHDLDDVLQKKISDSLQTALEKYVLEEVTRETKAEDNEVKGKTGEEAKEVSIFIAESEEEVEGGFELEEDDDDDSEGKKDTADEPAETTRCWLFNDEDEQKPYYAEEVGEEEMNTEELNQKFEDFIRRMKEEIVINEARHAQVNLLPLSPQI